MPSLPAATNRTHRRASGEAFADLVGRYSHLLTSSRNGIGYGDGDGYGSTVTNAVTNAVTNGVSNAVTNGVTNGVTNAVTNAVTICVSQRWRGKSAPGAITLAERSTLHRREKHRETFGELQSVYTV